MIRKGMAALLALLLFAGCGNTRKEQTDALRSRYRELESWKTTVQLALPREEETAAYSFRTSMRYRFSTATKTKHTATARQAAFTSRLFHLPMQ